ncbi:MAG: hypothetical protein U0U70_10465 [Chitinophagaceae bacterium]
MRLIRIARLYVWLFCLQLAACLPGKHFSNWNEKPVKEVYSGGYKWDISLTLYKDSTFRYVVRDDMLGIPRITTGAYLKTDSTIDLYTWKMKYLSRKSVLHSFRLTGDTVKMYPPSAAQRKNGNFVQDYFTLTRSPSNHGY